MSEVRAAVTRFTAQQELEQHQAALDQKWQEAIKSKDVDKLLRLSHALSLFHFHDRGQADSQSVRSSEKEHHELVEQSQKLQKKRIVCALSVIAGAANIIGGAMGIKAGVKCVTAGVSAVALKAMKAEQAISTGITGIGGGVQALQKPFEDHSQRGLSLNQAETEFRRTKTEQERGHERKHRDIVAEQRRSMEKVEENQARTFSTVAGG